MQSMGGAYACFNEAAANRRGKRRWLRVYRRLLCSFNEAAANRRGKRCGGIICLKALSSFNEAAANRRGKLAKASDSISDSLTLQ